MALTATFFAGLTAWREFKMRENEKRIARPS